MRVTVALAAVLAFAPLAAHAQPTIVDETTDRVLILHASRGTLAPGTKPKCFSPNMDETSTRAFLQCPWEPANGRPRAPTARSLFGLLGTN